MSESTRRSAIAVGAGLLGVAIFLAWPRAAESPPPPPRIARPRPSERAKPRGRELARPGLLEKINRLIKDSGQRFGLYEPFDQTAFIVVLTRGEERRLVRERGWTFD